MGDVLGPVADGVEVAAALYQRIHAVVDRDEADAFGRKVQLRQFTDLQVLTTQPGHILHDQGTHQSGLNERYDVLPRGTVKVGATVTIVRHEHGVLKSIVGGVLLQITALRRDLSRWFSPIRTEFTEHSLIAIEKMAIHFYNIKYTL